MWPDLIAMLQAAEKWEGGLQEGEDGTKTVGVHEYPVAEGQEKEKGECECEDEGKGKACGKSVMTTEGGGYSYIMEAEIVGVKHSGQGEAYRILPFQDLSTRPRGTNHSSSSSAFPTSSPSPFSSASAPVRVPPPAHSASAPASSSVAVMIFAFDLIHWCGTTLLTTPFVERRQLLRESFVERSGYFEFAASTDFEPDTSVTVDSKTVKSSGVKKLQSKGEGKGKDEGKGEGKGKDEGKGKGKGNAKKWGKAAAEDRKEMEIDEDASDAEEQEEEEEEEEERGGESDGGVNNAIAAVATERDVVDGDGDGDEEEEKGALGSAVMQCLRTSLLVGEGLMVKSLASPYEPARRSDYWIKAKKDYIGGLSLHDSLDLVPLGAWRGHGRKSQWLSPVLLGVYDEDTDTYQTLCKCMSGFTDAFYKDIKERWGDDTEVRGATKSQTDTSVDLTPPVYFPIGEVWEVRGADITVSPNHTAAQGLCHPDRGLSLRFPRFIRTRPDKRPQDATTARQIADMYRQQNHQAGAAPPGAEDLFD
jgi:hypothetical protein